MNYGGSTIRRLRGRRSWKADFPSGLGAPTGITSQGGALYVVNSYERRIMAD